MSRYETQTIVNLFHLLWLHCSEILCPAHCWWCDTVSAAQAGCTGTPASPGWGCILKCYLWRFAVTVSTASRMWGDTRKVGITWWELDRAVGEHQPSRRTNICSFVEGGAEEHCQSSTKWLPACFWQNCQSQTPWVRHQGLTSFSGTDTRSPAPWSSIGICSRTPEQADPPMAPRVSSHQAHVTNATLSADVLISVVMRQIDPIPDRRDLSCNTELPEFILEGLWHDFICVPVCSWYSLKTEVDWLWVDRRSSGYVPFRCFQSLASGEIGCLQC